MDRDGRETQTSTTGIKDILGNIVPLEGLESPELNEIVQRAIERVPYYKYLYSKASPVRPVRINDILPTDSRRLIENSKQFLCYDAPIALKYLSGGTIGRHKEIFYTKNDWKQNINLTVKFLKNLHIRAKRVLIMHPFAPWAIGENLTQAFKQIGLLVEPLGNQLSKDNLIKAILSGEPAALAASPTMITNLVADIISEYKSSPNIEEVFVAGEPFFKFQRQFFESQGIISTDIYGMAEADTMGMECCEHNGIHLDTKSFFFELILDKTNEKRGELLVTPIKREGMIFLRYRTNDYVEILNTACPCGSKFPRVRIVGRVDEAVNINGVKISLWQIQEAILLSKAPIKEFEVIINKKMNPAFICLRVQPSEGWDTSYQELIRQSLLRVNLDWEDLINTNVIGDIHIELVNKIFPKETQGRGKAKRLQVI